LAYLENVDIKSTDSEQGFYMPVQRVCRPNHTFRGFQGQVEAGSVSVGDEITVLPSAEIAKVKSIFVGDKQSETAIADQPVTITLNKEIDVSRGCVFTKDNDIKNAKAFNATLLWMDDTTLSEGKEYFVKLGTKKIAGKVKKILYKTDINSGEQINVDSLSKNEIALCEISLDEEIPVDLFKNHKTLGELILIDRISNMTSACGVVEEIVDDEEENGAFIVGNGVKAKTLLFDEFFYSEKSLGIDNYSNQNKVYEIGDTIPLKGESYDYPTFFDILILSKKVAIEIRNGIVSNVKPIDEYQYIGLPIVNGKGFSINVNSQEELDEFFADLKNLDKQNLYEKWMKFETYRKIIFTSNYWGL
jgi:sulfate adenylyltransferase subunit 1